MDTYNKLKEIQKNYPQLTFNNEGYEYLSPKIKQKHDEQIKTISELLKPVLDGFVRFDNFKPRKDGTFAIRVQCNYSPSFTGVRYFNIEDFKEDNK